MFLILLTCLLIAQAPAHTNPRPLRVVVMLAGDSAPISLPIAIARPEKTVNLKARARHALDVAKRLERSMNGHDYSVDAGSYRQALADVVGNYYFVVYDFPDTPEAKFAERRLKAFKASVDDRGILRVAH